MSNPGRSTIRSIGMLANFLLLCLIVFSFVLLRKSPWLYFSLAALLVVVGLPLFIYGLVSAGRYKDVFDYEPTIFLGKQKNGSQVRDMLMTATSVGLWCSLSGIVLFFLGLF